MAGPGLGWGELPIFAAWLALGAMMTSVLAKPPTRERDLPETSETHCRWAQLLRDRSRQVE
jgi:hypothetical protein